LPRHVVKFCKKWLCESLESHLDGSRLLERTLLYFKRNLTAKLSHPPIRNKIIEKQGKEKFLGIYSGVSLATFLPTTLLYRKNPSN